MRRCTFHSMRSVDDLHLGIWLPCISCGNTGVVCGTRIADPYSNVIGECVITFGALGFLWSCRGTENRPLCIRICSEIVGVGDLVVGACCWLGMCVTLHNSERITTGVRSDRYHLTHCIRWSSY